MTSKVKHSRRFVREAVDVIDWLPEDDRMLDISTKPPFKLNFLEYEN